jgi:hypothetical protein
MKPTALGILRSGVSFDCLRSCGSAADHRHARAGRHDDNRRQLSSASAPAVRRDDQHGWAGTAGYRFSGGQSAGMQTVVQADSGLHCTSKVNSNICFGILTVRRFRRRSRVEAGRNGCGLGPAPSPLSTRTLKPKYRNLEDTKLCISPTTRCFPKTNPR